MLCFYQMFFHSFLVNPSFQFLWPADTDKLYTHIIISSTEISFPIIITCDLSSVTQQDTHVHLSICVSLVVLPNYICMSDLFIVPSSTQTHEKESNTCFAFWHQQVKINRKNNQIKPFFSPAYTTGLGFNHILHIFDVFLLNQPKIVIPSAFLLQSVRILSLIFQTVSCPPSTEMAQYHVIKLRHRLL